MSIMLETIDCRHALPDLPRTTSARQALALALPAVHRYDADARWFQIHSDLSIDHHGFTRGWDLAFDLPHRHAQAFVTIRWHDHGSSWQDGTGELRVRVRPFMPQDSIVWQVIREGRVPDHYVGSIPGNAMEALLREGELNDTYPERAWQRVMAERPVLPMPFRDSPEAVQSLIAQGADFESGPTDMHLESRVLPDGQVVWWVQCYRDYTTPFAIES